MSKGVVTVATGYKPRALQAVLHRQFKRFNVVVCHRRFGKTHLAINEILDQGLRCNQKNPQYAYIAPTYGQAKRIAWDLLKDYTKNLPGVSINESDLRIDISRPHLGDRVRIMLLGAENPDSIRGIYLDGCVLDEFAEMNPQVWSMVVRPALSDRIGWAVFIGTPKGQNHFYDIYKFATVGDPQNGVPKPEDWFSAVYKASETGIIPIGELEAARAIMDEHEYEQEFECSFTAALVGAYYGKEMAKAQAEGRITRVPYDPALPCFTYWDLGIDDSTAIWVGQRLGSREVRWINYIEDAGQDLEFYLKQLQKLGYMFAEHVLPHDAAARELGTGKTREETIRNKGKSLGLNVRTRVLPRADVADGINASRLLIAKSWFDAENCKRGIDALTNYERKWDPKNKIYQQRPLHNWASHGADAFRQAAMGMNDNGRDADDQRKLPRYQQRDFDIV